MAGGSVALDPLHLLIIQWEIATPCFTDNGTNERYHVSNVFPTDVKTLKEQSTPDSSTVTGTNTGFVSDLKVGDLFEVQDDDGV